LEATFFESGASLSTIETVDTENPHARAMSSKVTWPDFRCGTSLPPRIRALWPIIKGNNSLFKSLWQRGERLNAEVESSSSPLGPNRLPRGSSPYQKPGQAYI
jgi:hypothetical protein